MLSNPPFGVEWKKVEKEIRKEHENLGFDGRFGPGLPRVSDGSLLFLLHLLSKMRPAHEGGSRFGIVLNGSPLFTGGAGSGESEIRRYVLENDLVEKVRQAVSCMTTKFDEEHPLARIDLHTDGLDLFVKILEDTINVSDRQQTLLLRGSLETHLKRIERDETKLAKCLYPFTRTSGDANSDAPKSIVIDPRISFGKPVIAGTGIPTAVLAGRYKAGDSIEVLAEDYQCEPAKIQEAVRCELSVAA